MNDLAIQDNDRLLASKQLNLVYQRYPLSFASSLLLSGALVAALWPIAAPQTLLAWMLSLWLVMGVRSFYSRRYLRMGQSGAGEHGKWRTGLVAGSVVAGVCWGVTVFLFLESPHDEAAVLVMFIIAGVTAFASVTMSAVSRVAAAFLIPALLPLAVWLFSFGERIHYFMGAITLGYLGLMLLFSRQMHQVIRTSLSTSEQNRELAAALRQVKALERESALFRHIVDDTLDPAIFVGNAKNPGRFDYINEAVCRHFGASREEIMSWQPSDWDPHYDADRIAGLVEALRQAGTLQFESEHLLRSGERIPVEVTLNTVEHDGETFVVGYFHSLVKRKAEEARMRQLELAAAHQENDLRMVRYFDNAPGFFFTLLRQPDGRVSMPFASAGINELYGLRPEHVAESIVPLAALYHLEDLKRIFREMDRSARTMQPYRVEFRVKHPENGLLWVEARSMPHQDTDGSVRWYGFAHDITERKHAEESLQKRGSEFRTLTENSPDPIYRYDRECRRVYVNPAVCRITGKSAATLLGKTPTEAMLVPSAESERAQQSISRVLETGMQHEYEVLFVAPDGSEHYFLNNLVPEFGPDGAVESVLSIGRDITTRKRYEQALLARAEQEQRFASYLHSAPGFFFTLLKQPDGNVSMPFASAGITSIYGLQPEDVAASVAPIIERDHPDDVPKKMQAMQKSGCDMAPCHIEFRVRHPEKGERWVEARSMPQQDEAGNIRWHGFMHDITERKQMESEMQRRDEYQRTLLDNSPYFVWLKDKDSRLLAANLQYARVAKVAGTGDLEGKTDFDFFPHDLAEKYVADDRRVMAGEEIKNIEEMYVNEHGERLWMETWKSPVVVDGQVVGTVGCSRDITERKRMEEELAARELEFRTLAENFPDVVIRYDLECKRIYVNPALEALAGCNTEKLCGKKPKDYTPLIDSDAYMAELRKVMDSGVASSKEVEVRRTNGEAGWYMGSFVPEFDGDGNVSGLLMVARDITELKRMEQTLFESEEKHRTVFESANDGIFLHRIVECDGKTEFILHDLNRKGCELWGHTREEILAGNFDLLAMNNPPYSFDEALRRNLLAAAGEPQLFDWELKRGDDSKIWGEVSLRRIQIGGEAFLLAVMRDLNERKAIEKALHDSEHMLQEAQRIAHVGSWDVDMVNDKLTWSDEIFRIWEIDKAQFRADFAAFLETVHPEDRGRVVQAYNEAVVNHTLYEVEHRLLFPDGRVKYILERGEPQYDAQGKPVRFIGTSLDITERKLAEQYEQFRSHTLELLAGNHSLPIILEEIVRGVEQLNSRMLCSILLLDSQGKHLVDGVAPSLPDFYNAAIDGLEIGMGVGSCGTCAASGERVIVDDIQTHPYWAPFKELAAKAGLGACWSQPVCSSSGKVLGTFAIYHREAHSPTALDISLIEKVAHIASIAIERKRMEAELAERERDFRSLAENLPDNIARFDVEGRYLYINPTHERLLGVSFSDIAGTSVPDSHEQVKAAIAQVVATGLPARVEQRVPVNGNFEIHSVAFAPEFDAAGRVVSVLGIGRDMTDIYRMQEIIAERERDFRSLAENLPDNIARWDTEGRYLYINRTHERTLGVSASEVIGKPIPDSHEHVKAAIAQVVATGQAAELVRQAAPVNGELQLHEVTLVPEFDAAGHVVSVLGLGRNMTEYYRMQETIAAREQEFRSLAENLPDNVVRWDGEGRYIYINPTLERALGARGREMYGKRPGEAFPDGRFNALETAVDELLATGGETRIVRQAVPNPEGGMNIHDVSLTPEFDVEGRVISVLGLGRDITDMLRMQETIAARAQEFHTLVEQAPEPIFRYAPDGRRIYVNAAVVRVTGLPVSVLLGEPSSDGKVVSPQSGAAVTALVRRICETGEPGEIEVESVDAGGHLRYYHNRLAPEFGADGKVRSVFSISHDITERKQVERQLKETLEFSEGVINAIPDMLFEVDHEGRYLNIWAKNPELLAAQKELLLGKTVSEMLSPEAAAITMAALREAEENGVSLGKTICLALPQGDGWFELSVSRMAGRNACTSHFLVVSRDVTERKRTEDVLRFIAQGEWLSDGDGFLSALARYLGKLLGVDYVLIDKFAADPAYAETVVLYAKGDVVPNRQYALQSAPCGEVMAGQLCCYRENVQGHFPEAGLLMDMQAESYIGLPLWDADGKVFGLIAVLDGKPMADTNSVRSVLQIVAGSVAAELTRNQMEEVLRESYASLREAQRISHVGNWELDLASGALVWSDEIYRIFEIDPELFDASYEAFLNAIHPDDREAVNLAYTESLESRAPYEIEHRLLFADGRIKYVHERCETHYGDDGKPVRSLGTVQDITARKQAEEALRDSLDKITHLNRSLEENALHLEENARNLEEQATELEASQEQLKQTEAWYRSILHSAPDGMLVVDERGLIMQVNARLEAMFGYERGELAGSSLEVLLPQTHRESHVGQRAGYFASGVDRRAAMAGKSLFGCRKDGSVFPVDVSLSRLPEIDGMRNSICASVRDITEWQAMEAAREAALAEALRLAQLRSAFMAQMSHELRTPLNGILGYTQNLLHGESLGEKQAAGLNIIQHSGEHLLSLINGLLDHAAIEADKFELISGDIELDPFLRAIIGIIRVRAEQKNISFTCDAGEDLPAIVRGDAQRLRQVLLNLLANAVKFTDSGSVVLRVNHIAPSRIRFEVQDSGVGIGGDQLEKIFLPFEQTGETSRRAGGTGLGLSISRKLVMLMGGDIQVESQPGTGSTFSFEIEMEAVQSDSAKFDAVALSEQAATQITQATQTVLVPPREALDILYSLAMRGSMRDVMRYAAPLVEADERYQPFVEQLRQLARNFQTKALLSLIDQYRNEQEAER